MCVFGGVASQNLPGIFRVIPVGMLCWELVPVYDVANCGCLRTWSLNVLIKAEVITSAMSKWSTLQHTKDYNASIDSFFIHTNSQGFVFPCITCHYFHWRYLTNIIWPSVWYSPSKKFQFWGVTSKILGLVTKLYRSIVCPCNFECIFLTHLTSFSW